MTVDTLQTETLQDLAEAFSLFDNWEDRYRYLIDLGGRLPEMGSAYKTDHVLVKGCTSRVWLISEIKQGDDGQKFFQFKADSDAMIVRGLIAILMAAYQGRPLSEIPQIDIEGFFEQVGLSSHLSPNRRSGFFAMVETIRAHAVAN